MTEPTSHVEQQIQAQIAAARFKVQAAREKRASLAEARRAGLARRHAARLRNQAAARTTDGSATDNASAANDTTEESPVMQYEAILIGEDGTIVVINLPANREHFAEYAAAVLRCTTVEAFDLAEGITLWLDEEGRGRWPYNALIDALANRYGHTNSFHGPVLITGYGQHVEPLPLETALRILGELNRA